MRGLGFVVWSCVVGACFKPALEREVDGDDTADVAGDADDGFDTSPDLVPDSDAADTEDTTPGSDKEDPDTDPLGDADSAEPDTTPSCTLDNECAELARPPCVVGRCVSQRCAAVNVSVPCDDGEVCTTADQCQAGVCQGRPFTEDEAKSWYFTISGPGEDAAVAVAPHPGGDFLVTGAFTGTVAPNGGPTMAAEGKEADAFLLRVTPRGQILRAVRLGSETRDVGVSVSPAEAVAQVVVGLNSLHVESGAVTSAVVWVNDNGTVRETLPVPGKLIRLESQPNGLAFAVVEFTGAVELNLAGGGQVAFTSDSRNAFVMAIGSSGVSWARRVASSGDVSAQALVLSEEALLVAIEATGPAQFGVTQLGQGGMLVELSHDGAYISHQTLQDGIFSPSTFLRNHFTETRFFFEGAGEFFPRSEIQVSPPTGCVIALPFSPENRSAAWGFGRAWPAGVLLHGLAAGTVDFGGAALDFQARPGGVMASFDQQCGLRAAWASPLPLLDNGPASLRFAAADLSFYLGDSTPSPAGGLTIATTVKQAKSLGPDFGDDVVSPVGGSDGLVGGYSPVRVMGCPNR